MNPTPALRCRHCGSAITALQQGQGGICGQAACRHRQAQTRWSAITQTLGKPALQAAAPALGGRPATLLWLRISETKLVRLSLARRRRHLAHLQGLIAPPLDPAAQPLAPAQPASTLGAQEWRLCAQCRGRCCTEGGSKNAFMTLPQLLRWQSAHPGSSLPDAVAAYMDRLPARHVHGACVYQGAKGCVLPREERADICNSYACDPLVQVQQALPDTPDAAFVAVTVEGDTAVRQALIQAGDTTPLP